MAMLTSDVLDLRPDAAVCSVALSCFGRDRAVAGKIRTVRCFEDNALVKAIFAEHSDGEILVVDGEGSLRTALMGDQIASAGCANGWAGAIVLGAIRDSAIIDTLDFHVKALGTNPRKSSKRGSGERDRRIEFGGMHFVPGEYLYSDADGIVVLSQPLASSER